MTEYLTKAEAIERMPLLSVMAFTKLMKASKGPKFARQGARIVFRATDVDAWYSEYENKAFSHVDTRAKHVRTAPTKVTAKANGKTLHKAVAKAKTVEPVHEIA